MANPALKTDVSAPDTSIGGPAEGDSGFLAEAARIHAISCPIDAHTDVPLVLDHPRFDFAKCRHPESPLSQVDAPRIADGGAAGIFFALFTGQGLRTPEGHDYAFALACRLFERTRAMISANAGLIEQASNAADFGRITTAGRTAIFLCVENGWPVGRDLSRLTKFHEFGARYLGLCHFAHNDLCDSSTDERGPEHGGLSALGCDVVRECNRLGILVDVSHASDDAARQAAQLSHVPVIASHSNCKAVFDHPRNLPDDVIRLIAERGGVVHATLCNPYVAALPPGHPWVAALAAFKERRARIVMPSDEQLREEWDDWESCYIASPPPLNTVSQFVDHIDHVVRIAGIDHVGFGSDFNGGGIVAGCEDVSCLPAITAELLQRGYAEDAIRKFWSGNTLRVLGAARA